MGIVPTTGFWPLFSPLLKGATKTDGNVFQANDKLEQFAVYLSLKPSACTSPELRAHLKSMTYEEVVQHVTWMKLKLVRSFGEGQFSNI
jgi:hypothetical protein